MTIHIEPWGGVAVIWNVGVGLLFSPCGTHWATWHGRVFWRLHAQRC